MNDLSDHVYGGARALVLLHERHLKDFLQTWREAKAAGVTLPETEDPSYASMQALLRHVLRAARGYMVWICEKRARPDPGIEPTPDVADIEDGADGYLDHLLERWRGPLADLTEKEADGPTYPSRWGPEYCVDAMLEHAVMHPIRHAFQLRALMSRG